MDSQDVPLDIPVTNLGLDSLIAIEVKNWVSNTLQAPVKTTDIMDSPSLRKLAGLVAQRSRLLKANSPKNTKDTAAPLVVEENMDDTIATGDGSLPKMPLQPLEATLDLFLESVSHLGSPEELQGTKDAIAKFLQPDGVGRRLQGRLEKIANDPNVENWMDKAINPVLWLYERNWHPRVHNFFFTHPLSGAAHTQAERAALVSLAAYEYKMQIDAGILPRDYRNEQPLSMESISWLFNSNKTPVQGCDRVDRYPGNEYIVAMRRGHVFQIPLREEDGLLVPQAKLIATFQAILETPLETQNWAPMLTTDNRDEWAKVSI